MLNIFTLLSFLGLIFSVRRYSRLDIMQSPFFAVSILILVLYISAYLKMLPQGAMGLFVLGLGAFLYELFDLLNTRQKSKQAVFTSGFVVWMVFTGVLCVVAYFCHLSSWDEFSHWGPHSKIMFLNNGFENAGDMLNHKSYPPAGRLLHYFFYQLGGFDERKAYIAQTLLIVSPLAVLLKGYVWPNWRRPVLVMAFAVAIFCFYRVGLGRFVTLYMDAAISTFAAMSIVYYLQSDKSLRSVLTLVPVMAVLMLLKLKLMPFVLLVGAVIAADQLALGWVAYRQSDDSSIFAFLTKNADSGLKMTGVILLLPIVACFAQWTWVHYLNSIDTSLELSARMHLSDFFGVFGSGASEGARETLSNLCDAFLMQKFTLAGLAILSFISCFLVKPSCDRYHWFLANVMIVAGMVLYFVGLMVLYLFVFQGVDGAWIGIHLPSFERYLNIYYLLWSLVIFATAVKAASRCEGSRVIYGEYALMLVAVLFFVFFYLSGT